MNRYTAWVEHTLLVKVHVLFSELIVSMTKNDKTGKVLWIRSKPVEIQYKVLELKRLLMETFIEHCTYGVFSINFHLVDHVVIRLRVFWTLFVFYLLLFEQNNIIIMQA